MKIEYFINSEVEVPLSTLIFSPETEEEKRMLDSLTTKNRNTGKAIRSQNDISETVLIFDGFNRTYEFGIYPAYDPSGYDELQMEYDGVVAECNGLNEKVQEHCPWPECCSGHRYHYLFP